VTAAPGADDVRLARPEDLSHLRGIEAAADELYLTVGIGPFAEDAGEDHLSRAAVVFVSGTPPVGFASVELVDGAAHIWQLSVLPSAGRQGRGTALVTAVCDWAAAAGYDAVTLTTFRDVPWNAPFYARLGFRPVTDLAPELAEARAHERAIGDDDFGPRLAMRKDLARPG